MFTISRIIRPKEPKAPENSRPGWFAGLRARIEFLIDPYYSPVHRRSAFSDCMSEFAYGSELDAEINAMKAAETRERIKELNERELSEKVIYLDEYRGKSGPKAIEE